MQDRHLKKAVMALMVLMLGSVGCKEDATGADAADPYDDVTYLAQDGAVIPQDAINRADTCEPGQCGGVCGPCPAGYVCAEGGCCKTTCEGKSCGDDGCGGICPPGCKTDIEECIAGVCQKIDLCGNAKCDGGETHCTCPEDCQAACGDGCCTPEADETDGNCPIDCKCYPACDGKECGDDGCGGQCQPGCAIDVQCLDGECVPVGCGDAQCLDPENACNCPEDCQVECGDGCCSKDGGESKESCPDDCDCTPQCEGKQCGPDGCGDVCGECQEGTTCKDGLCSPATCGNNKCDAGESYCNCIFDCDPKCGDGCCSALAGENADNCAADCT
jgi:hypothetical protein